MNVPKFLEHMSMDDIKYIYSLPVNKRMEKIMFCCDPKLLDELPNNNPKDYDVMKGWLQKQIDDKKVLMDKQGLILAGADRALREMLSIFRDDPIEGPLQEASMGVWTKILQEES